jgi:hypothetical protein
MESFTKESVRELSRRLQETLDRFAKENGMKAIVGNASFTPFNICYKIELATIAANGEALTRDAEHFFHHAPCYGLAREDLGKSFRYGDRTYKIVGLNTRSRSAPVIVSDDNGKSYKFKVELLKALLSAQKNDPGPPTQALQPLASG